MKIILALTNPHMACIIDRHVVLVPLCPIDHSSLDSD